MIFILFLYLREKIAKVDPGIGSEYNCDLKIITAVRFRHGDNLHGLHPKINA